MGYLQTPTAARHWNLSLERVKKEAPGHLPWLVWLSLVFILLNTLEPVVPERISFKSADGTIQHHRLVDAFVDNAAIGLMDTGELS